MKISDEVKAVLAKAEVNGNAVKLVGQLDRKLYTKVNEALVAAGGKWNTKAKAHLFDTDASEIMEQMISDGEVDSHKDFDYFPTPSKLVTRLIELAEIGKAMKVLEPSAGTGNIAKELIKMADVDCVELREEYADKIRGICKVQVTDFLTVEPNPIYDRVVMNPPFGKQADIKHVTHALKFLKKGGRLVSIMASGVTFRQNKLTETFNDLLGEYDYEVLDVPEKAFKDSGTMVKTVILVVNN